MINWFPGHMSRAVNAIKSIKPIDLIIEVIDARAIMTSKNENLISEFNKPKMTIALKEDLTDTSSLKIPDDVLVGSIKDLDFKREIIEQLYDFFQPKIDSYKNKGLINPQFHILVLGLPNIGKSSLINFLSSYRNKTIVENRPGVTKKNNLIKINDSFYIYDTPGIMVKKIETDEQGYILSLLNLIRREVIPLEETCAWVYDYLNKKYKTEFLKYFPNPPYIQFDDFIEYMCRRYNFITQNNIYDKTRAMDYFLNLIMSGEICKINYEK